MGGGGDIVVVMVVHCVCRVGQCGGCCGGGNGFCKVATCGCHRRAFVK